jgi:hypothetical protein
MRRHSLESLQRSPQMMSPISVVRLDRPRGCSYCPVGVTAPQQRPLKMSLQPPPPLRLPVSGSPLRRTIPI